MQHATQIQGFKWQPNAMIASLEKPFLVIVTLIVPFLLMHACTSSYNTDVPPPTGKETYAQVMPTSIGGQAVEMRPLPLDKSRYHGARAQYGGAARVEIIEVLSRTDLDAYVSEHIKPRLDGYSNRVSGKFNGAWSLRASGKTGRLHAWQNHNWLFVIEASNDKLFDEVVDHFAYIRRR